MIRTISATETIVWFPLESQPKMKVVYALDEFLAYARVSRSWAELKLLALGAKNRGKLMPMTSADHSEVGQVAEPNEQMLAAVKAAGKVC